MWKTLCKCLTFKRPNNNFFNYIKNQQQHSERESFCQDRIDRGTLFEPFCKMKIVGNKYHFFQNEGIYNGEPVEMVFYTILRRYHCFMKGQYSEQRSRESS